MFLKQTKCKLCSQNRLSEIIYLKYCTKREKSVHDCVDRKQFIALYATRRTRHTVRNIPEFSICHKWNCVYVCRHNFGLLTKPKQSEANRKRTTAVYCQTNVTVCWVCVCVESITAQNTNNIYNEIHILASYDVANRKISFNWRKICEEHSNGFRFFVVVDALQYLLVSSAKPTLFALDFPRIFIKFLTFNSLTIESTM